MAEDLLVKVRVIRHEVVSAFSLFFMLIECFDCISKPQKGGNSRTKVDFYCTGAAVGHFLNICFTKYFFPSNIICKYYF